MYSIQEVSQKTGLTAHTLRYYEKEGLLSGVERTQGGFRQYTDEDLERLGLICCLKNTGMPLQESARFVQLAHQGDRTLEERAAENGGKLGPYQEFDWGEPQGREML